MLLRVILCLLLLPGCQLLTAALKGASMQIKAVIEGEIYGHEIRCEKTIDLADGEWGVLCAVDNGFDVKYRVRSVDDDVAHVEFTVGNSYEGRPRLIAAPSLLVKRARVAKSVTTTRSTNIVIMAERTL